MFAKLKVSKNGAESNGHDNGVEPEKFPEPDGGGQEQQSLAGGGLFNRLKGKKGSNSSAGSADSMVLSSTEEPTKGADEKVSAFAKLKGNKGSNGHSSNGSMEGFVESDMQPQPDSTFVRLKGGRRGSDDSVQDILVATAAEADEKCGMILVEEDMAVPSETLTTATTQGNGNGIHGEKPVLEEDTLEGETEFEAEEDAFEDESDGTSHDIEVNRFNELVLDPQVIADTQACWADFISTLGSREAAGEALFGAFFDSAPALQSMFTAPRAVQAMRFFNSMSSFVQALGKSAELKILVETLGFGHLTFEVTVPRVVIFRDAVLDLFDVELGEGFLTTARVGFKALMNYAGGAMIYVKTNYANRLRIIEMSWSEANKGDPGGDFDAVELDSNGDSNGEDPGSGNHDDYGNDLKSKKKKQTGQAQVPSTFKDMFSFNLAIMGFEASAWMTEILCSFDSIVRNISNTSRLQEECEVLALRISKATKGPVNLSEFKACMLASLRSLLPKIWEPSFEVAWSWVWENVERLLQNLLGQPQLWEKALLRLLNSLDENARYELRAAIYARFFDLAPSGQDYFKQSNTRLHFIADRVFQMTMGLYKEPGAMVEEISALGLRHVGYAIPTELFGPFVTASCEIVGTVTKDNLALESYRWSLALIAKILVRTITEGSTIVMKAINANSTALLKKAVSCAPRANRATWLLLVQVGSQQISPLLWAIESGSLDAAAAIIEDLLTIRADRDRYYYGVDELFGRHPDIVYRVVNDAPTLMPTLLEGLIWRSRQTHNACRRVNYYVKHLLVDHNGGVSQALKWLAAAKDVKIIAHPLIAFVSDTYWNGVVRRQFSLSKIWFVVSLLVFVLSQSVLSKLTMNTTSTEILPDTLNLRIAVAVGRIITYGFTLLRLLYVHLMKTLSCLRNGQITVWIIFPVPDYLQDKSLACSFVLFAMLVGMCQSEPMFYCRNAPDSPTEICPESEEYVFQYSVFSMIAMAALYMLVIDLSVFSTKLSAFVLVWGHVLNEVGRFMVALMFLLLTFASAISVLKTEPHNEYASVPSSVIALFAVTVGVYEKDFREMSDQPVLLGALFLFFAASGILLLNLLIAQLNCSYEFVYADMVGFARMNRATLIVETLVQTPANRWAHFVKSLDLDQYVEFDEGDIGPAGAIQILEASSMHSVLTDQILRFGGSTNGDQPWPEDTLHLHEQEDKFERLEALLQKALKRAQRKRDHSGQSTSGIGSGQDHAGKFGATTIDTMLSQDSGKFSGSDVSDESHNSFHAE